MEFNSSLQRERDSESGCKIHVGGVLVSEEEWSNMNTLSLSEKQYTSTEIDDVKVGHVFIFKPENNTPELPLSDNTLYRLSSIPKDNTVELTELGSNKTVKIKSLNESNSLPNNPIVGDPRRDPIGLRFVQDHIIATELNQETKTFPYTI